MGVVDWRRRKVCAGNCLTITASCTLTCTDVRLSCCRRSSGGAQLTFFQHLLSAYSYHLQKIAQVNPDVHLKLFRVIHLIDPLSAMFSPYLVARALLYWAAGVFPTLSIRRSKA